MGLTQAELARRVGISHSYLNLIERNKRGIAGKLMLRVAEALGVDREALDGAAERRLFDALAEIAADPRHAALAMPQEQAGELVGRFPGWAEAMARLARSERGLAALTQALNDRLTHDPFLGEAVHRMLTHTAALRAAAEILRDVGDLGAEDRARFTEIVADESTALSEVGTALAGYFDRAHDTTAGVQRPSLGPVEAVDALFEARANHFAEIETARDTPAAETAVAAIVDRAPWVETADAAAFARRRLQRYAADAAAAPLAALAPTAEVERYDVERIAERLGIAVDVAFRRLACLPPAPGRPRFGYLETNAAGVATEVRSIPNFAVPRHGAACPLWINHRAAVRPGETLAQIAAFPTGLSFLFVARTRPGRPAGYGSLAQPVTDMLVLDAQAASATVYGAAALDTAPVGQSCGICPRTACTHRAVPAVG
ncbi:MAG: short-chain fatty acyl-CoA regulator family protein [Pseudomonadota bacterium]